MQAAFPGKRDPLKQMGLASGRSPDISAQSQTRWERFIFGGSSESPSSNAARAANARFLLGNGYRDRATVPLLEPSKWTTTEKNSREAMTFPLRPRLPCAAHCANVNLAQMGLDGKQRVPRKKSRKQCGSHLVSESRRTLRPPEQMDRAVGALLALSFDFAVAYQAVEPRAGFAVIGSADQPRDRRAG